VGAVILYPAIDLKGGDVVRLKQGDMNRVTVYGNDPAARGKAFQEQGFEWLHLVDLDGAFIGRNVNAAAVENILAAVTLPVQLGGGIRDKAGVEFWLGRGVARVILGTAAVRDPAFVKDAAKAFPGKIAVGIDAKDGRVAVEGWAEVSDLTALELAQRFEDAGVCAIIYTDISRDGLLMGLNLPATRALAQAVSIPVIASGGLAGMDDITHLLEPENRIIAGAIAGRALYDGRLDAVEAMAAIRKPRQQEMQA
jgi:phosphoribosylformimino-5-aminoimidazole carboxamide ribotide isomerase